MSYSSYSRQNFNEKQHSSIPLDWRLPGERETKVHWEKECFNST